MLPGGPDHHPGRPGAAWANAAAAALSWDVRAGAAPQALGPAPGLGVLGATVAIQLSASVLQETASSANLMNMGMFSNRRAGASEGKSLAKEVLDDLVTDCRALLATKGIKSDVRLNVVCLRARDRSLEIVCNGPDEYGLIDCLVSDAQSQVGQPPSSTPRHPVGGREMVRRVLKWIRERP